MSQIDIKNYNKTEIIIHHAAQILAFLGKKLGQPQSDDRHTTARYHPQKHALIGQPIQINKQTYQVHLFFNGFYISLISDKEQVDFPIEGKLVSTIVMNIRQHFKLRAFSDFKLHYKLPKHYNLEKFHLYKPAKNALSEWGELRFFAENVFKSVNEMIEPHSPIRIWPHHFDTGTYHVLRRNEKTELAAIGCGFAMKDSMVKEPYFYIYGWKKSGKVDFRKVPNLTMGEWKTGDWQGAVLPITEVFKVENQKEVVEDFYRTALNFYKKELN